MANDKKTEKEILASNLTFYRKNAKLTQLDLAEKFNYSDKAISKWERGESAPDVFVLKALAEFYGITLNDFFKEKPKQPKHYRNHIKHIIITALSIAIVWLVATIIYVFLVLGSISYAWFAYIAAIPVSFILCIVFSALWGNKLLTFFAVSLLCWTTTLLIYLPCELLTEWSHMYLLWCIPIPLQVMAVLWYLLKMSYIFKKRSKKEDKELQE